MLVMANPGVTGAALFIVQVKIPVLTKKTFFLARELACLLEKGIWLMGSLAYWDQIWSGPE
jgi:hypothetical protein